MPKDKAKQGESVADRAEESERIDTARAVAAAAERIGTAMTLHVDGIELAAYYVVPGELARQRPALVLCNGYPSGAKAPFAAKNGQIEPDLADRIALDCGCAVVTFDYRGVGKSTGNFSLSGWLNDIRAAINFAFDELKCSGIVLAGFRTGGALCICVAAEEPRVHGVIAMGPQADFKDWATDPRKFLALNRDLGMIRSPDFPPDLNSWSHDLKDIRPIEAVKKMGTRPFMVIHGSMDVTTPPIHSEALAEAAGDTADLRILLGAGHFLRYDPRAIAMLLGWIGRIVN